MYQIYGYSGLTGGSISLTGSRITLRGTLSTSSTTFFTASTSNWYVMGSHGYSSVNSNYKLKILGEEVEFDGYIDDTTKIFLVNLETIGYKFWETYKRLGLKIELPEELINHINIRCKILKRKSKIENITDSGYN